MTEAQLNEIMKKKGKKYVLYSKTTGRRLSKPLSKKKAKDREKQIQFFKYAKKHGVKLRGSKKGRKKR